MVIPGLFQTPILAMTTTRTKARFPAIGSFKNYKHPGLPVYGQPANTGLNQ